MAIPPLPGAALNSRIERLLGKKAQAFTPVSGGYTRAQRFIVEADDGSTAFVKVATNERTTGFLRREFLVYDRIQAPFMPAFVAFEDSDSAPILIIEDLQHLDWPPPWTEAAVQSVLETIHEMHRFKANLEPYSEIHGPRPSVWAEIAEAPAPFLSLVPSASTWLDSNLQALLANECRLSTEGNALCHGDIRSDNLCIGPGGAMLIDWNNASLGNADLDLGMWLPSLCQEGGPLPEEILPHRPDIACWLAGYFSKLAISSAERLGTDARIHVLQRGQMDRALEWASRSLGLSSPKLD